MCSKVYTSWAKMNIYHQNAFEWNILRNMFICTWLYENTCAAQSQSARETNCCWNLFQCRADRLGPRSESPQQPRWSFQPKLYISTKTGCTNKLYLITQLNWFVFVNWQLYKQYNKQRPVDCTVYSVEYNKQHTHFWRRLPPWSPATKAALGLLELRYVPLFTTNSSSRSSSSSSSSSPASSPLQLSTASVIIALDSLTEFENQNQCSTTLKR